MDSQFYSRVAETLTGLERDGLMKPERVLGSAQGGEVTIGGKPVINLCANNYLGLASDPRVVEGAIEATRRWGAGLASVRFICGTQEIHKELERSIADYLGFEDSILFAAAFDANGGVFEPLLGEEDAIVSDTLNHASIIDGVRLSKAKRYRYATNDMDDLERVLQQARADGARTILVVTDGVFSMDGTIAQLDVIAQLAEKYEALTMVDDCHATGFIGEQGRGTPALRGVEGKIDIVTGTFGKALGGAMGGFIAARQPVIDLLRQRARPYLFSNALTPAVCGASLAAIEIARSADGDARRAQIQANASVFRTRMAAAGFDLVPGEHAIIPVMLYEAALAQRFSARLLEAGVLATGFSFPVVPQGKARIRTQMSAALSTAQVERVADIFAEIGRELRII
ncbi:glycine C-acetyltransferase [Sphingomonas kyeonggiensis]|uniref:2-amino-3-ketobutyrate coenzyme A ligase n=1 Tax=Sphingomonas kyeonggiensis TaxID=1268553 RepID=A0A7W7K4M8_9SPHN|nr:glycine C-acetyltransferase [Sphingomonas kyeonggiensis]MBB4840280.1 glycine C-acetyltransferase [Sphingomonas kyeonggiensis]